MSILQTQPGGKATLTDRMRARLEALGVTIVTVSEDGRPSLDEQGQDRWIEQLIVTSPPFIAAMRDRRTELTDHAGELCEIWPGVSVVPLPARRRRRVGAAGRAADRTARPFSIALLLGPDLLDSEQLRVVCDAKAVDLTATLRRINPTRLLSSEECTRLATAIAWMHEDSIEIDRRLGELQSLSQQLGESYEELSLLYKLSSNMTVGSIEGGTPEFLTEACNELCAVVGLKWMALKLIDDDPRLKHLAGRIFSAGTIDCDERSLDHVTRLLMARMSERDDDAPMIVDDTHLLGIPILPRIARDMLVIELARDGRTLGILFGGDKLDGTHISSIDSKLCNSLANSLAIFLENAMLYEDMHAMFLGTLHALTSSIDAKDSYTHGHSERVALMSRKLAVAAGLDDHTVERIYISALVHDVGKIGVPEAVLCKPGKLTDEEFEMIKRHPEIGARILQDIRQMQDLIPGVLYHHERWDGRGYPHKLSGQSIPLFGRVICLADSFDAMSSNRTYRKAMKLDEVLEEIRRCAGSQFDPELAQLFVDLDFTPFFEMLNHHFQQVQSEG